MRSTSGMQVVHPLKYLPESFKFKDRERSVEQMEVEELEDFIRLAREVMHQELQERCFDKKISNSRLVQVYMSKQCCMDTQKVLEKQHITAETLYKTYIRESNDVVKLSTRQMSTVPAEESEIVRNK